MNYSLPMSVDVNGTEYDVRTDYRAVLDIITALTDPELNEEEKALVALFIFYPSFSDMPDKDQEEAYKKMFWFIACGEEEGGNKIKLVDWEQDFTYIVAPINRVAGCEIRSISYLHWWTFISYYYEIGGDCTFAQIVRVRETLAKGKKMDKFDREWYRNNRHLVDFKQKYSQVEDEALKAWGVK